MGLAIRTRRWLLDREGGLCARPPLLVLAVRAHASGEAQVIHENERPTARAMIEAAQLPFADRIDERDRLLKRQSGTRHDLAEQLEGITQALPIGHSGQAH